MPLAPLIAAVMVGAWAASAFGQDLTPPPAGGPSIPAPITPETSGPAWQTWMNLIALVSGPLVLAGLWAADLIRPASFRRKKAIPSSPHAWPVMLMAGVLVYLSAAVGAQLVMNNLLPWPRFVSAETTEGRGAIQIGYYGLGIPAAITVLVMASNKGLRSLFASKDLGVGLLTLVLAYPVLSGAASLAALFVHVVCNQTPDPVAHEALRRIVDNPRDPWVQATIVCVVLGAPIIEEVVYRFAIQGALIKLTGSPWIGILTTSALFAASHLAGGTVPWHALPPLFVLSVALGLAHARTGRIGPCIIAHMGFNAFNILLAMAIA